MEETGVSYSTKTLHLVDHFLPTAKLHNTKCGIFPEHTGHQERLEWVGGSGSTLIEAGEGDGRGEKGDNICNANT